MTPEPTERASIAEENAVQKVKIFKGIETELRTLESEVNEFLASADIRVVNAFGNIAPQTTLPSDTQRLGRAQGASDVLLVIIYEEG